MLLTFYNSCVIIHTSLNKEAPNKEAAMSGGSVAILTLSAICIIIAGFLGAKRERGGAIAFGVLGAVVLLFAIGIHFTDQSRDAESSRVTTEIEARYKDIHVVELSAWSKTVRYTVNGERSKVCDGDLVNYNGDWLIRENSDCAVLPTG
jgi:hypothetical protein